MKTTIITLAAIISLATTAGAHEQNETHHMHYEKLPEQMQSHIQKRQNQVEKERKALADTRDVNVRSAMMKGVEELKKVIMMEQFYHNKKHDKLNKHWDEQTIFDLQEYNDILQEQNNTLRQHIEDLRSWNHDLIERIYNMKRSEEKPQMKPGPRCGMIGQRPCYKPSYPAPQPFYYNDYRSEGSSNKHIHDHGVMRKVTPMKPDRSNEQMSPSEQVLQ